MRHRLGQKAAWGAGALIALCLALPSVRTYAQQTLCAQVQLVIGQKATLEREAFDADLVVNNSLPDQPLTSFKVQVFVKDSNGNPADSLFFVKVTTLTGINAVDGTGVIQSSSTADIHWLIIPSTGAGGASPAGQQYAVSAIISSLANGAPQTITTFDAFITVQPQPLIKLEYALPYEVFGEEALLSPLITPIVPFPLAARVTNVGFGAANNFQIQSAQPQITDNKLGLLVDFTLLGTHVSTQTIPNTLLIPFGTIAPNTVSQAWWTMSATLSGRFVSFTSTFSHAASLGGQLTSLIQSVTTYTLLKDVLVDLPGRDSIPDFLVNQSADRGLMQTSLDNNIQPPAQYILESDQPNPLPVIETAGQLSGTPSGTNNALIYTLTQAVSTNVWVHSYVPWPYGTTQTPSYAQRADGKLINPANVWISKHFVKSSLQYIYWFNILDLKSSANTYTIQLSTAGANDTPPGAVTNLTGVTYSSGGAVALTWTAPGEDGYVGNLFGAHVFLDAERSTAAFSPNNAQVSFTTSQTQGATESFVDSGLIGNATYFIALFTQDTGGNMSGVSNLATSYTLPDPPTNLVITTVAATDLAVNWQIGNNNLPIAYQVWAATAPTGAVVSSSPYQDSFTRSAILSHLNPGTTYFILGAGLNPVSGVRGPPLVLGSTVTATTIVDLLPPRTNLTAGPPSFFGSSYPYVTNATSLGLSAVDDLAIVGDGMGVGVANTYLAVDTTTFSAYTSTFSLVTEGLHYAEFYSVDYDTHTESVEFSTIAVDLTPPVTTLSGPTIISTSSLVVLTSTDPVSNNVASGVDAIFYYVDNDPTQDSCFNVALDTSAPAGTCANPNYGGPFTLAPGTHTVYYFAQDNVANLEGVNIASFTVDGLPPRTFLGVGAPEFISTTTLYTTNITTFGLAAVDDFTTIGDGAGVGVANSYLAIDTTTFSLYTSTFNLPTEGVHGIGYYSVDRVGDFELAHSNSVSVDLTPPVTQLQFTGPESASAMGGDNISTATVIGLNAADPVSNNVASGVDAVFYYIDSDPTQSSCFNVALDTTAPAGSCANPEYGAPFMLSAGTHTLYYFSQDNVGNLEGVSVTSFTVQGDVLPPRTTLSAGAPDFIASSTTYATSATTFSLTAVDDVSLVGDGLGAVARTYVAVDTSAFSLYSGVFTIPAEGQHAVSFYSVDRSSNVEVIQSSAVAVDLTPPVTKISAVGNFYGGQGIAYLSSSTLVVLTSTDPVSNNVASGVDAVFYYIDADPTEQACIAVPFDGNQPPGTCANPDYDAPFTLAPGSHTVSYFADDNVQNEEGVNTASVFVDTIAPSLALTPVNGSTVTTATPQIVANYSDLASGVNAASVRLIVDGVNP